MLNYTELSNKPRNRNKQRYGRIQLDNNDPYDDPFDDEGDIVYKKDDTTLFQEDENIRYENFRYFENNDLFNIVYASRAVLENHFHQDLINHSILPYIDLYCSKTVQFTKRYDKLDEYKKEEDSDILGIDLIKNDLSRYLVRDITFNIIIPYITGKFGIKEELKRKLLIDRFNRTNTDKSRSMKYEERDRFKFVQDVSRRINSTSDAIDRNYKTVIAPHQENKLKYWLQRHSDVDVKYDDLRRLDDYEHNPRYYYHLITDKIYVYYIDFQSQQNESYYYDIFIFKSLENDIEIRKRFL
jgi:hypothetical protein